MRKYTGTQAEKKLLAAFAAEEEGFLELAQLHRR